MPGPRPPRRGAAALLAALLALTLVYYSSWLALLWRSARLLRARPWQQVRVLAAHGRRRPPRAARASFWGNRGAPFVSREWEGLSVTRFASRTVALCECPMHTRFVEKPCLGSFGWPTRCCEWRWVRLLLGGPLAGGSSGVLYCWRASGSNHSGRRATPRCRLPFPRQSPAPPPSPLAPRPLNAPAPPPLPRCRPHVTPAVAGALGLHPGDRLPGRLLVRRLCGLLPLLGPVFRTATRGGGR